MILSAFVLSYQKDYHFVYSVVNRVFTSLSFRKHAEMGMRRHSAQAAEIWLNVSRNKKHYAVLNTVGSAEVYLKLTRSMHPYLNNDKGKNLASS